MYIRITKMKLSMSTRKAFIYFTTRMLQITNTLQVCCIY